MANETKDTTMIKEIKQMTPEQAVAWCEALSLDWLNFDVREMDKPMTWIKALQARANDTN
jgi:hypothetical protein